MNTTVVRYVTRPESADENQRLIEGVYAELAETDPGEFRYTTFRLADGVTFVHIGVTGTAPVPLPQTKAFQTFLGGLDARCVEPPVVSNATLVGAYRW